MKLLQHRTNYKEKMLNSQLNNLLVYKKSKQLGIDVILCFTKIKAERNNEFIINQFLRSSTSIGANIAEGYGRLYKNSYRQFLSISRGSCFETLYWVEIAFKAKLLDNEMCTKFTNETTEIIKMLTTMMKNLQKNGS